MHAQPLLFNFSLSLSYFFFSCCCLFLFPTLSCLNIILQFFLLAPPEAQHPDPSFVIILTPLSFGKCVPFHSFLLNPLISLRLISA